jgi:uncharacterized membrane protein YesL
VTNEALLLLYIFILSFYDLGCNFCFLAEFKSKLKISFMSIFASLKTVLDMLVICSAKFNIEAESSGMFSLVFKVDII